jgi:hypothetical protein
VARRTRQFHRSKSLRLLLGLALLASFIPAVHFLFKLATLHRFRGLSEIIDAFEPLGFAQIHRSWVANLPAEA